MGDLKHQSWPSPAAASSLLVKWVRVAWRLGLSCHIAAALQRPWRAVCICSHVQPLRAPHLPNNHLQWLCQCVRECICWLQVDAHATCPAAQRPVSVSILGRNDKLPGLDLSMHMNRQNPASVALLAPTCQRQPQERLSTASQGHAGYLSVGFSCSRSASSSSEVTRVPTTSASTGCTPICNHVAGKVTASMLASVLPHAPKFAYHQSALTAGCLSTA